MNKDDILIVCALEEETNGKLDGWNIIYTGVGKVNATYELTAELFFQMKLSKTPKFDMEAYALAKVCYKVGIDFISYKYITDNANEKSADKWLENCSKGVTEFKKLLKQL